MVNKLESQLTEFIKIGIFNTLPEIVGLSFEWNDRNRIREKNDFNIEAFDRFIRCCESIGFLQSNREHIRRTSVGFTGIDLLPDLYKLSLEVAEGHANYEVKELLVAAGIQEESGKIKINWQDYFSPQSQKDIVPRVVSYYQYTRPLFTPEILLKALKSGSAQWENVLGNAKHPFFASVDPVFLSCFMRAMHMSTRAENKLLAQRMAIASDENVVDVGGGTGTVAAAIAGENTDCKITIFEPEDLISVNQASLKKLEPAVYDKIKYEPGDFFGVVPQSRFAVFDHVILGWILHDWTDEAAQRILKYCRALLKPGGTLNILESILPDNRLGNVTILDMIMLLQTEGKERTLSDYKMLLKVSGFEFIEVIDPGTKRQLIRAKSEITKGSNEL